MKFSCKDYCLCSWSFLSLERASSNNASQLSDLIKWSTLSENCLSSSIRTSSFSLIPLSFASFSIKMLIPLFLGEFMGDVTRSFDDPFHWFDFAFLYGLKIYLGLCWLSDSMKSAVILMNTPSITSYLVIWLIIVHFEFIILCFFASNSFCCISIDS